MTLLISACTGLPANGNNSVRFKMYTKKVSFPFGTSGNSVDLSFRIVECSQPGPVQTLVQKILYNGRNPEEYGRLLAEDWKNEFAEFADGDPEYTQSWDYTEEHRLVLKGNYAVITQEVSYYQGGAHPNWFINNYILDTEEAAQLRLGDIIPQKNMPALTALTNRQLRIFSEKSTGESLPPAAPLSRGIYFEDTVDLSEDFYPTAKGLTFQWDPYEIAPYAAGSIEITLSWQELENFLSPEGKKLATVFAP
ncbi:MAG: RsiV family protein [Spirochaetaceae bacterium]|nr:RsiV family protein [Spirochaetaceae bacterium]